MDADNRKRCSEFYYNVKVPDDSTERLKLVKDLVSYLTFPGRNGEKIAFITSGGTNTLHKINSEISLENFSTGRRGAEIAERLLEKHNYYVIFLYREGSKLPFRWKFDVNDYRDFIDKFICSETTSSDGGDVIYRPVNEKARKLLQEHLRFHSSMFLTLIKYRSADEYQFYFKKIMEELAPMGKRVTFVSAAAVSDFIITNGPPPEPKNNNEATQKVRKTQNATFFIESAPKTIPYVLENTKSVAFHALFKLVTDPSTMDESASRLLNQINVKCVVGNVLSTRYQTAYLYYKSTIRKNIPLVIQKGQTHPLSYDIADFIYESHTDYLKA